MSYMLVILIASLVLDNSLVIAVLGLVTVVVPALLALLSERAKGKRLEVIIAKLEEMLSEEDNTTIFKDEEIAELRAFITKNKLPNTEIAESADPVLTGQSLGIGVVAPTGKLVVWVGRPLTDSPRYVLFTSNKTEDGIAIKVRDYPGGRLWQHPGATPQAEPHFQLQDVPLTLDALWASARCHLPASGRLDHRVEDFPRWEERLRSLTDGHERAGLRTFAAAVPTQVKCVLLMLSSAQQPPPREEVGWHAAHPSADGMSYVATTRKLTGLIPGKSIERSLEHTGNP